jgi:hypothetical protein
LADTAGLVGYMLNAQPMRKTFWTFSVWDDQASLDAFAAAEPHHRVTRRLAARMGHTRFSVWTVRGDELPWSWEHVTTQLADDVQRVEEEHA